MSGRWKGIAATAAAAAAAAIPAGVVLAHGLGDGDRPGQAPLGGVPNAPLHAVGTPASPRVGARSGGGRSVALSYLQTRKLAVPAGRSSQRVGPTPKNCRAINGYYFIPHQRQTRITSEGDSLAGFRHWLFYRNNKTGQPVKGVVYGVICLRGAKLIG